MWQLTSLTKQRTEFNFSEDRKSVTTVSQLYDHDTQLINAVELIDWVGEDFQFILCEICGNEGCAFGGWVTLKRAGEVALIMPAFEVIEKYYCTEQYWPPHYLLERGVIFIEQESYNNTLCNLLPLPGFDSIASLSSWETAKLFQFEAPNRILGNFENSPELHQDILIASSEGNLMKQTTCLTNLVEKLLSKEQSVQLRKSTKSDQVIIFYLDIPGI